MDLGSSIESLKIEKTLDLDALQRTERSLALLAVDNQTRLLEEEECRKHDERRRFEVLEEENLARAEAKKADEERLKLRRVANVDKVALPGLKNKRV